MPDPTEPCGASPTAAPAPLAPGEAEIIGDPIPVTIDAFLRSIFRIGDVDYCSIKIPTDEACPGSFKVFAVPRSLVRVPAMIRGTKL